MTTEDKELLLKDLSARLPYGVKAHVKHWSNLDWKYYEGVYTVKSTFPSLNEVHVQSKTGSVDVILGYTDYVIKPYLFPLESMTEEMLEELNANGFFKYRDTIANVSHLESKNGINEEIYTYIDIECISFLIEYFHSHHIDYKGFIEKNLAIDATGLNIY